MGLGKYALIDRTEGMQKAEKLAILEAEG